MGPFPTRAASGSGCEYVVWALPGAEAAFCLVCWHAEPGREPSFHAAWDGKTGRRLTFGTRTDARRFAGLLNQALRGQQEGGR